jgi:hypothetical protein
MGLHVVDHGHQVEARAPDPVAERAAVEVEPLPLEDPGPAVERQVVAELRNDNPRDQALGLQPARHDVLGRMRLHHGKRAAAAGVSGALRHQNSELRRAHAKPLRDILPDPSHQTTAEGAEGAGGLDRALDYARPDRGCPRLRVALRGSSPHARCSSASAFSCAASNTP